MSKNLSRIRRAFVSSEEAQKGANPPTPAKEPNPVRRELPVKPVLRRLPR